MSPAINEELLVLAMCAYGGLVLMVCYDAIRIFRRDFRASIRCYLLDSGGTFYISNIF